MATKESFTDGDMNLIKLWINYSFLKYNEKMIILHNSIISVSKVLVNKVV